jgi:hypothetical protein
MNKLTELIADRSDYSTFMDMVMDPPMILFIVAFGYYSIKVDATWLNGALVLGSLCVKLYEYKRTLLIKNICRIIRKYGFWTLASSAWVFCITLSIFFLAPGIGKALVEDTTLKAICYFLVVLPILKVLVLGLMSKKE